MVRCVCSRLAFVAPAILIAFVSESNTKLTMSKLVEGLKLKVMTQSSTTDGSLQPDAKGSGFASGYEKLKKEIESETANLKNFIDVWKEESPQLNLIERLEKLIKNENELFTAIHFEERFEELGLDPMHQEVPSIEDALQSFKNAWLNYDQRCWAQTFNAEDISKNELNRIDNIGKGAPEDLSARIAELDRLLYLLINSFGVIFRMAWSGTPVAKEALKNKVKAFIDDVNIKLGIYERFQLNEQRNTNSIR